MRQRGNALLIILIVAGILALVGYLLLQGKSSQKLTSQQLDLMVQENGSTANGGSDALTQGRYVEYTPEGYEIHKNKRRVLYFYANWCPTCRPADANLKANESQIPEDLVVFRVNYNDSDTDADEQALANEYGITYQHTFVQIDAEGKEVTKWNGGAITELLANIK